MNKRERRTRRPAAVTVLFDHTAAFDAATRRYHQGWNERFKSEIAGLADGYAFIFSEDHEKFFEDIAAGADPGFVLNLAEYGYRASGGNLELAALLAVHDIPYSGFSPENLILTTDKHVMMCLARDAGVSCPRERLLDRAGIRRKSFVWPSYDFLLKPQGGEGGSYGITDRSVFARAADRRRFWKILTEISRTFPGDGRWLLQEYLSGAEYSVGVIGNQDDLTVLPVLEFDFAAFGVGHPPIRTYAVKNDDSCPEYSAIIKREAGLGAEEKNRLIRDARLLFDLAGCRDYARIDFKRGADGIIRFLEVNANPGIDFTGGNFIQMARLAGWTYADAIRAILEAGLRRTATGAGRGKRRGKK